jgi:hypothetical protein
MTELDAFDPGFAFGKIVQSAENTPGKNHE